MASLRCLTKVPRLTLVYFSSDQTTSIVETKKIRDNEGNQFCNAAPNKFQSVSLKVRDKTFDAIVIASDGKFI